MMEFKLCMVIASQSGFYRAFTVWLSGNSELEEDDFVLQSEVPLNLYNQLITLRVLSIKMLDQAVPALTITFSYRVVKRADWK